jgi:hypothetical protein
MTNSLNIVEPKRRLLQVMMVYGEVSQSMFNNLQHHLLNGHKEKQMHDSFFSQLYSFFSAGSVSKK